MYPVFGLCLLWQYDIYLGNLPSDMKLPCLIAARETNLEIAMFS
jgi:hypothetical protein